MTRRTYGSKYDASLSTKEIAARIRADLKAAVKDGTLPPFTYSVRMDRFAGGSSIDVEIKAPKPADAARCPSLVNPARAVLNDLPSGWDIQLHYAPVYSPAGTALLKTVEGMLQAYNHDGSDTMSDYFDVKFYGHARIAHEAERAAEIAAVAAYKRGAEILGPVVVDRSNPYGTVEAVEERIAAGLAAASADAAKAADLPVPAVVEALTAAPNAKGAEAIARGPADPCLRGPLLDEAPAAPERDGDLVPGFVS